MTKATNIYDDERGAIMAFGVFMSILLVGMVWYLIGIGDALLYRERLQDGADTAAFASAVYHARGMNLLAMINIIMAAIVGVLVALKILQLVNGIALAVSCALAPITFGATAPICAATGSLAPLIGKAIGLMQGVVDRVIPVLSKTQKGIALTVPFVAEAKAISMSSAAPTSAVRSGFMVSTSLVPFVPTDRYALPVAEADYNSLCGAGANHIAGVVFLPFGKFAGWVGTLTSALVTTFPLYFCGDTKATGPLDDTLSLMAKQADAACVAKEAALTEAEKADFTKAKCVDDAKKEMEDKLKDKGVLPGAEGLAAQAKTPKKVHDWAENGNGLLQVWALVSGNIELLAQNDGRLQSMNWKHEQPPVPEADMAFAQAEYYYDTKSSWAFAGGGSMWGMRWKARLVRFQPIDAVSSTLGSALGAKLYAYIDSKTITKLAGKSKMFEYFSKTKPAFLYGTGNLRSLTNSGVRDATNDIENAVVDNPSFGFLH